jgi:hypothetical protein
VVTPAAGQLGLAVDDGDDLDAFAAGYLGLLCQLGL